MKSRYRFRSSKSSPFNRGKSKSNFNCFQLYREADLLRDLDRKGDLDLILDPDLDLDLEVEENLFERTERDRESRDFDNTLLDFDLDLDLDIDREVVDLIVTGGDGDRDLDRVTLGDFDLVVPGEVPLSRLNNGFKTTSSGF